MLDSLRQLLTGPDRPEPLTGEEKERALRLATGALLVEVARADGHVAPEERATVGAALERGLGLAGGEAEELLRDAEAHSREATSVHDLTRDLDRALSAEDKTRIVELLWQVAFADGKKDPHEEQRVRQIAGLLHVRHADFIAAKIRALRPGSDRERA